MGADGGYRYVQRSELRRGLSEADIELFIRFTRHSLGRDVWKEDLVDVAAWEKANMTGAFFTDWLRYPDGTDIDPEICVEYLQDPDYGNSPDEVWYWREWIYENSWKFTSPYYWWGNPLSWYAFSYGTTQAVYTVPNPEELEALVRITDWITEHHPFKYLETWT